MHDIGQRVRRTACLAFLGVVGAAGFGAPAWASPPREPLPVPLFSFDLNSPSIPTPGSGLGADALLAKGGSAEEFPIVVVPAPNLGLGRMNDDLQDISFNRGGFPVGQTFMLMFTVDRESTGDFPPDPAQLAADAPFTVADQAVRGHAAGDGFLTLNRFDRNGVVARLRVNAASNTAGVNNYDEGGHDFQAQPATSARDYVAAPQDNVDGLVAVPVARGVPGLPALYYTVNDDSTSLRSGLLPGTSGADIFLKVNPTGTQPPPQLFATADQLGLPMIPGATNDIDALIVFDNNTNGIFDGSDLVLFSLTPDSVALAMLPGVSTNGAADIFAARHTPTGTNLSVYAPAEQLGLAGALDNVDGLELYACDTAPDCALAASIQLIPGDANNDGAVSLHDFTPYPMCLSGPKEGVAFALPSPQCRDVFDFNRDTDVDLHDFQQFQQAFGTVPP